MKHKLINSLLLGGAVIVLGARKMQIPAVGGSEHDRQAYLMEQTKSGEMVFKKYCASCHQSDGSGVPYLAPPLAGTKYVLGDKARLIRIVLNGLNEDIEIEQEHFTNPMPPFNKLNDKEIAGVLTYVRSHFGNKATAISPSEVKAERALTK